MPVRQVTYDVDGWGTGELWLEDGVLVWHELPRPRAETSPVGAPQPTTHFHSNETKRTNGARRRDESVTIAQQLVRRIQAHFAGRTISFDDVPIDLDWCTPFQRSVAETLRGVPRGEVVSYGELAALAGYPNAQRAAGTFCAHNRIGLLIPCHRVVAADGLGSYGSLGQAYKRRLLALEGVEL